MTSTTQWTVVPDPLAIGAGSPDSPACSLVDFGVEGEPSSQNVSLSGTAPYDWVATDGSGLSGTGTLTMSTPTTPPCDDCEPSDPTGSPTATQTVAREAAPETQAPSPEAVVQPTDAPVSPSADPSPTATAAASSAAVESTSVAATGVESTSAEAVASATETATVTP